MSTTTNSVAVSGGGLSISKQMVRTTDGVDVRDISLPVGQPGSLTTRTNNTAGTLLMTNSSHGIITGQKIDVSWALGVAYNATVGTVNNASVPFTLASGDSLPLANTAIVAATPVTADMTIEGDRLAIIAISLELPNPADASLGKVRFLAANSAELLAKTMTGNNPQVWDIAGGSANPFAGMTVQNFNASNGSSANPATLKIISAADNTP
jgi:hypothetical protein